MFLRYNFKNTDVFSCKNNTLNFWTKNALFGLGCCFKRTVVISKISTLEFFKNEFLAKTKNLDTGTTFSKRPGSAFSQDQGLCPTPLYKVSPYNVLFSSFNWCTLSFFYEFLLVSFTVVL